MKGIGKLFLIAALVSLAACSGDQPTAPVEPQTPQLGAAPDGALETSAIASSGITSDQANASSVLAGLGSYHESGFRISLPEILCGFNAVSGRVECADISVGGLVFTRSWAFYDAAGKAQPKRDTSTVKTNHRTSVKGTATRDSVTLTLDRQSDFTQDGVQKSSKRRTQNGWETGRSEVVLRSTRGTYRSVLTHADSTQNLVTPQNDSTVAKWPLSGTIVKVVAGTRSKDGSSESHSFSRREVMVFDGTSKVKVTITVNGVTRTCVRDLENRKHECS